MHFTFPKPAKHRKLQYPSSWVVNLFLFLFQLVQLVQEAAVTTDNRLVLPLLVAGGVGASEATPAQVGVVVHRNTRSAADTTDTPERRGKAWHGVESRDQTTAVSLEVPSRTASGTDQHSSASPVCAADHGGEISNWTGWCISLKVRNKEQRLLSQKKKKKKWYADIERGGWSCLLIRRPGSEKQRVPSPTYQVVSSIHHTHAIGLQSTPKGAVQPVDSPIALRVDADVGDVMEPLGRNVQHLPRLEQHLGHQRLPAKQHDKTRHGIAASGGGKAHVSEGNNASKQSRLLVWKSAERTTPK